MHEFVRHIVTSFPGHISYVTSEVCAFQGLQVHNGGHAEPTIFITGVSMTARLERRQSYLTIRIEYTVSKA